MINIMAQPVRITPTGSRTSSAAGHTKLSSPTSRIQHFDGDVPPSLSPLDAFAAHSRRLARELEETRKAGERRLSRLPPQIVTQSLTDHQNNRPPIFRALSDGLDVVSSPLTYSDENVHNSPAVTNPENRPVSSYPGISRISDFFDEEQNRPVPLLDRTPRDSKQDLLSSLIPPRPAFAKSQEPESSDEEYSNSVAGSTFSRSRKLSASSGVSGPHSPALPCQPLQVRPSSRNSLASVTSPPKSRSHLNFSRPMSSAGFVGSRLDLSRQQSKGSLASHLSHPDDASKGSGSFDEARSVISEGCASSVASHNHASNVLPRGRMADRNSAVFLGLSSPALEWQEPLFPSTPPLLVRRATDSIASPAQPNQDPALQGAASTGTTAGEPVASERFPSLSEPELHGLLTQLHIPPIPNNRSDTNTRSSRSNSTIRPSTARTVTNTQSLSTDEHVTRAIELHQHGDLKESTYHLRIAAKQDHPTGMLLYALACRHGWGIRANQKEGVEWLRKAVDSAMLEVADDEDITSNKPRPDFNEKKTHRAQFALSVYELGVSHMNGWGIEQDKALALRCFEIAGNWGDTDALMEAGYCYAKGVGCKKDLKKAAGFYRKAETRGASMVGNSWIYKEKYNDPHPADKSSLQLSRKSRDKSKTKSIFGRKKEVKT